DLPRALDVLTDLIRNPVLRTSDLELERKVVLEEINTVADTPDDQVFDLSYETLWPDHPYGYSILGTRDTVSALSAGDLKQLHGRAYFPANCVIAAAGNLTHETLLEELAQLGWFDRATSNGERVTPSVAPVAPAVHGSEARHPKDTAQTHIVFGTDTVPYADPRKYALLVLANVFGGGMSSRLFQRIREELGLAYAIYAFTSFYHQMGVAGVYGGTQPQAGARGGGRRRILRSGTPDGGVAGAGRFKDVARRRHARTSREGVARRRLTGVVRRATWDVERRPHDRRSPEGDQDRREPRGAGAGWGG